MTLYQQASPPSGRRSKHSARTRNDLWCLELVKTRLPISISESGDLWKVFNRTDLRTVLQSDNNSKFGEHITITDYKIWCSLRNGYLIRSRCWWFLKIPHSFSIREFTYIMYHVAFVPSPTATTSGACFCPSVSEKTTSGACFCRWLSEKPLVVPVYGWGYAIIPLNTTSGTTVGGLNPCT